MKRLIVPTSLPSPEGTAVARVMGECKVNGQGQEPHEPTEVATEVMGWQEHRESIPPIDLTSLVLLSATRNDIRRETVHITFLPSFPPHP